MQLILPARAAPATTIRGGSGPGFPTSDTRNYVDSPACTAYALTERQESRLDKSLVEMKRRLIRLWKGDPDLSVGKINPY